MNCSNYEILQRDYMNIKILSEYLNYPNIIFSFDKYKLYGKMSLIIYLNTIRILNAMSFMM